MKLGLFDYIALAISRLDRFLDLNDPESARSVVNAWQSEDNNTAVRLEALDSIIEMLVKAKGEIERERGANGG